MTVNIQPPTGIKPSTPAELRNLIASAGWTGHTAGILDGFQQANLVILPKENALDFARFCLLNPKPCPIITMSEPGDPIVNFGTTMADIRTEIPRYRVWKNGSIVDDPTDILDHWRDDSVAFLLGCSFTFEGPLERAGIDFRSASGDPSVYVSNIQTRPSGPFAGPIVVTMRAVKTELVPKVVEITGRYPKGHGAPIHIGDPGAIGINLDNPAFGPIPALNHGQTPVFWACGVTPQKALEIARPTYAITHYPACMFVFDHQVDVDPLDITTFPTEQP